MVSLQYNVRLGCCRVLSSGKNGCDIAGRAKASPYSTLLQEGQLFSHSIVKVYQDVVRYTNADAINRPLPNCQFQKIGGGAGGVAGTTGEVDMAVAVAGGRAEQGATAGQGGKGRPLQSAQIEEPR